MSKDNFSYCSLLLVFMFLITAVNSQQKGTNARAPRPVNPVPSPAQMLWHEMEMNAFIHFTTNTFTDKEWGYGDESPSIFNPTGLDAEQWAKTLKETGFKTMILTCKHHDGFCLWPSKYTEHSVKSSPYKNGKGDVVKEASNAAKKYGLKFGVYIMERLLILIITGIN
jgi:alpha-L-fucosidase